MLIKTLQMMNLSRFKSKHAKLCSNCIFEAYFLVRRLHEPEEGSLEQLVRREWLLEARTTVLPM